MTLDEKWRTFCVSVNIEAQLNKPIEELEGLFQNKETGVTLSPIQAYNELVKAHNAGFEVLPPCDNHNEKGVCQGHAVSEEKAKELRKR